MRRLVQRRGTKAVRRLSRSPRSIDVSRSLRETRTWLRAAGVRASDATVHAYRRALDYGSESPRAVALIALGAGIGIGVLCQRQLLQKRHRRESLSSLARAIADAVLDRR